MIYKTCRTLPIHNFNEIGITGDLSYLISDGSKHTEDELKESWLDILNEFIIIHPDQTIKYENDLKEKLFLMVTRLVVLENMINLDFYPESILKKLNLKKERVRKEFNKTRQKTAHLRAKLKTSDKVETEVNGFEKTLAHLTKFYGAKIDRHTTTVSEWLELKQAAIKDG